MGFFVYVLISSKNGAFIFEQTNDIKKRIEIINNGYLPHIQNLTPFELFAFNTNLISNLPVRQTGFPIIVKGIMPIDNQNYR